MHTRTSVADGSLFRVSSKGFTMGTARRTSSITPAASHPGSDRREVQGHQGRFWRRAVVVAGAPVVSVLLIGSVFSGTAAAAQKVQLGTASPFAVLAGSAVSDIPTSVITGDVGLSPAAGTKITGLTKAEVTGSIYTTDGTGPLGNIMDPARLTTAQNDLTTAYVTAANQPSTTNLGAGDNQLGGQTLTAGVYAFGHAATANITAASPLVLNGQGDPNAVFVFQASSDLITAPNSVVRLENGAQACNVFWQVTSSATLDTGSTFVGTIMALTSATLNSKATVEGRVLARNGAVTLDANTITVPTVCNTTTATTPTPTTTPGAVAGTTSTGSISTSGSVLSGGASGGTGSAAGTTSTGVVPLGAPHTGLGGASHSRDDTLITLGALALVAAASTAGLAVWRRRRASEATVLPTPR